MRPRHWKQLLRLAGGSIQISNEGLTRMTLGQLLDLGLHSMYRLNSKSTNSIIALQITFKYMHCFLLYYYFYN